MNNANQNLLVCTVLPTYNERDNIGPLIEGVLDHAITRHLVIVVDDNSPDGTGAVVDEMVRKRNNFGEVHVVHVCRTEVRGLTSAIQHGVDLAIYTFGADIVTWMDCDLSMPPTDVPLLVRGILDGADVSVGSRWVRGGADVAHGAMARALSLVINGFAMVLLGLGVRDYTSGFIAARAEVLQRLRLRGDYGEYCIDLLGRAQRYGYKVREVPYRCVPRTAGESKTGIDLWDYLDKGRNYVRAVLAVRMGR